MQTRFQWATIVSAVAFAALGACADETDHTGLECKVDADCGGTVPNLACDQSQVCSDKTKQRVVHVGWTINGSSASGATCTPIDHLTIEFTNDDGSVKFGFDPVPCTAGQFPIDKMPIAVIKAKITGVKTAGGTLVGESFIDGGGNVSIDIK